MKIALLTASCRGGGAERVQITLAREFKRLGHCVHLVSFEDAGPLREELPSDIPVVFFRVSRVLHGIGPLVRFLKSERPDVVIAAMDHVGTAALLAQILARYSGKVLVRADGSRRRCGSGALRPARLAVSLLQRCLYPRAYAVLGVSTAIAEEFREDLRLDNCHIMPNPVVPAFNGKGGPSRPAHPFFDAGEPVVIAVGRLNKIKGFSFLLRAFAVLRRTRDVKLIILGEGEERKNLEREMEELNVKDHVSLPGFVHDPCAYMRCSSVFAAPAQSESFGLALVEALSIGLPVVSTDTEGPRDILNSDRLGELVPLGDVDGFAAALERSLGSTERNREARVSRSEDYAPHQIALRYCRLMENS